MKSAETAIGELLKRGGFIPREVRFTMAIAEFLNNGGDIDRAHELIAVAADRMGSEGQTDYADSGSIARANASRTNAAKGQIASAEKAGRYFPDAAPDRSAGHFVGAEKAGRPLPDASPLKAPDGKAVVREHIRGKPGHAKRGAAAIAGVQSTMKKTLFDTYRLPGDDRAIGDITWKELQGLARKHAEAYRLLSLIDGYGQPADQDAPVRDVLKEETLREFVEIARLSNVH